MINRKLINNVEDLIESIHEINYEIKLVTKDKNNVFSDKILIEKELINIKVNSIIK